MLFRLLDSKKKHSVPVYLCEREGCTRRWSYFCSMWHSPASFRYIEDMHLVCTHLTRPLSQAHELYFAPVIFGPSLQWNVISFLTKMKSLLKPHDMCTMPQRNLGMGLSCSFTAGSLFPAVAEVLCINCVKIWVSVCFIWLSAPPVQFVTIQKQLAPYHSFGRGFGSHICSRKLS